MAARKPQNVVGTAYGTDWLKIEWDDDTAVAGDAPEGFKVWWDDTSVTVPTWTEPPAVDTVLKGGDGGSPVQHYVFLVHVPSSIAAWWETFEEYLAGTPRYTLDLGGEKWDGGAVVEQNFARVIGSEDFESYPVGVITTPLDGGEGWDGPAVITEAV